MVVPYFPRFNASTWVVGLKAWQGMNVDCLNSTDRFYYDAGVEIDYLKLFAQFFNKTLSFVLPNSEGCGRQLTNGTWTGLFGELEMGKIDLIGNLCAMYSDRTDLEFAKFSIPIAYTKQSFLIKAPTDSGYKFDPQAPFQRDVWYAIVAMCFVILILNSFLLKTLKSKSFIQAFRISADFLLQTLVGFEFNKKKPFVYHIWYSMKIFLGFISLLYAMYITGVLFKPFNVRKPFENNLQLARAIASGQYRLISQRKPLIFPRAYNSEAKIALEEGVAKFGYRYFAAELHQKHTIFNEIIESGENYVFVNDKIWMDTFLKDFSSLEKLWHFDDALAANTVYGYFYKRNDLEMVRYMDKAIVLTGDYKQNLYNRHFKEIVSINRGDTVSVEAKRNMFVSLDVFYGPIVIYTFGTAISVATFFVELKTRCPKYGVIA